MGIRSSGRKVIKTYPELPARWVPYDVRFPVVAAQVASLVRDRMPKVSVEHIGSTAVLGCGGKGVIDVMVECATESLEAVKELLADLASSLRLHGTPFPKVARCDSARYGTRDSLGRLGPRTFPGGS